MVPMDRKSRPVRLKEYSTDEIVVEWRPNLCFHSQNCVRALPQVFDKDRRPWIAIDAAGSAEIEAAVSRCPSGALRPRRLGSEGVRPPATEPQIRPSEPGHLL